MNIESLIDTMGGDSTSAIVGLAIGLLFGAAAQRSQFCLRAATLEFWHGRLGPKTAIWLLAFGAALAGTQALVLTGTLDPATVRQLSATGSMSGAMMGGLMFGAGMVLARGCASRLLVLSATGNLRALMTGLVLTIVAQASLRGVLSPLRLKLSSLWLVDGSGRDISTILPHGAGLAAGITILLLAAGIAIHQKLHKPKILAGIAVGGAVAGGWLVTALIASQSFDIVQVQSISFTGPSADTLMALVNEPSTSWSFGLGLIPGVFAGSLAASILAGDFKIQTFTEEAPLPRYIAGACLMGFGSMLAGGCAVGAGMTGGAVLASTAWTALFCMWLGAGVTGLAVDRKAMARATA